MIDVDCWQAVAQAFSVIDHTKRPHDRSGDAFGDLHVLLFGDFKQDRQLFRTAHFCKTPIRSFGELTVAVMTNPISSCPQPRPNRLS